MRAALAPLLVMVAACAPTSTPRPLAPAPPPGALTAPLTLSADAGVSIAPVVEPVVDLLHTVEATVAVSSTVDNPRDFPEHLVDGKLETAWNGKTRDLVGAFVAVRVPASARVKRIELTAGFDRTTSEGDLFTMNYRIKRIRVLRGAETLAEATLDTSVRGLQAVDVDAPGGDFRIVVLEVEPGTKRSWRELTISEFRVLGTTGGARENPAHMPHMAIGSLDGVPPAPKPSRGEAPRGPFESLAILCRKYDAVMEPQLKKLYPDDQYPGAVPGPHCTVGGAGWADLAGFDPTTFRQAPFVDASLVSVHDFQTEYLGLALRTSSGWWLTALRFQERDYRDPGCMRSDSAAFVGASVDAQGHSPVLLVRYVEREARWGGMDPWNGTFTDEIVVACRMAADGSIVCERPQVVAHAYEPVSDPSAASHFDRARVPWEWRKNVVVGPAGDLRLLP